jgi:GT2 family glycosyltransferase
VTRDLPATSLVSVVVPTRNRAGLLRRTLHSICSQQTVEIEVIVVDDASTDGTPDVARSADPRVRVVRRPEPSGVSAARNDGIAAARGHWVAFCDDDDVWAPEKLSAQLSAAQEAGAAWVYTGDVNVDDDLRVLSGSAPPGPGAVMATLGRWNPLGSGGSNVVVRRDVLAGTGGFDPALKRTEDWDLWLRLARIGPPAWVCRPLVAYRFHRMNIAAEVDSMVAEPRELARRYGIPVDLAAMHRRAAWTALRGGRRREAVRHYVHAVRRGDVRSLARAAFALLHPAVGTDALFRRVRRDPGWVRQAESWLAVLGQRACVDAGSDVR